MYIKEVKINSFKELTNITIGPLEEPTDSSDLVVLVGPNGSGKSSILELTASGLAQFINVDFSSTSTSNYALQTSRFEIELDNTAVERDLITQFFNETATSEQ